MGLDFFDASGQTPLDTEESEGLLIPSISMRSELDEFEQGNIEEAIQWVRNKNLPQEKILSESFILNLHKRMYGKIWKWAGEFRKTNKNIGVDKILLREQLLVLLDDTAYWISHLTYLPDEIAIRLKHRLVSIHCFSNGNGRHSRLMADILVEKIFGHPVFTWGTADHDQNRDTRNEYIDALKEADKGNIEPLLKFSRS